MNTIIATRLCATAAGMLLCHAAFAANYTFYIEPAYPQERLEEIYAPLMKYLGKNTGHEFEIKSGRNYHFYWRDLQAGAKADFAFEEAHFTAYRIQNAHFVPLVQPPSRTATRWSATSTSARKARTGWWATASSPCLRRALATLCSPSSTRIR
jgi:ABC-type phosphate/phosphonate transport system substrate-binding protein